jgi:hypothetical protein
MPRTLFALFVALTLLRPMLTLAKQRLANQLQR